VKCLESTRQFFKEHGHEVAAVIVEPLVLGAGGQIFYPKAYLSELVQLAKAHGALVIYDEVFTGFGRTGTLFALEQVDPKPDIVCLSKGLTSGMLALGATVIDESLFAAFCGEEKRKFYHGHTFTANPLACAVALERLRIFAEQNTLSQNEALMDVMGRQQERFLKFPFVGQVRQLGMIWAMEIVQDKVSREKFSPANRVGWKVAQLLWQKGIWIRPLQSVIYCIPPYCTTPSELERFYDELEWALREVAKSA